MKLSELVLLKKRLLEEIDISEAEDSISELLHDISAIENSDIDLDVEIKDFFNETNEFYRDIKSRLGIPLTRMKSVIANIDQQIEYLTKNYMARGYMINGFFATNTSDVTTERYDRILTMRDETKKEIKSRIDLYADWHYPGLEIGPGDGIWTEHLVACDPLYVVDIQKEFLENTSNKFPEAYQRRLRTYWIDRFRTNEYDLSALPEGQVGFVFAWNVFNYFPLENLKQYLLEIYRVMRPGGVMMFSYNNGENPVCIEYVEIGWMSYMPKTLLVNLCRDAIGFDIIETFDREDNIHWIEVRKPGKLSTVKSHQVLGKISDLDSRPPLDAA